MRLPWRRIARQCRAMRANGTAFPIRGADEGGTSLAACTGDEVAVAAAAIRLVIVEDDMGLLDSLTRIMAMQPALSSRVPMRARRRPWSTPTGRRWT